MTLGRSSYVCFLTAMLGTIANHAALAQSTPQPPAPLQYSISTFPTVSGTMRAVHQGDNLQAVLDMAQPGDEIIIDHGATFTGNYTLPVQCGTDPNWIVITTDALASLPTLGQRVDPTNDAQYMPKILTGTNPVPALNTAQYANGCYAQKYWITGLEIAVAPGVNFTGDLLELGYESGSGVGESDPSHMARNIYLDRSYVHGQPSAGSTGLETYHGVVLAGAYMAVFDSYISNFQALTSTNKQAQAITSWDGIGPFQITDNYLEASTENIMFGGSDPSTCAGPSGCQVPSDITITKNTLRKPLYWKANDPSWQAGTPAWCVGDLFELKNAQRVLVDGNDMEYSWVNSCDQGTLPLSSIQLTPRNQGGTDPAATVQDIQFTNNIIGHVPGGFNLLGRDYLEPSQIEQRIQISNNLVFDLSTAWNNGDGTEGNSIVFKINPPTANSDGTAAPAYVTIDHNTFVDDDSADNSYIYPAGCPCTPDTIPHFTFTNNIVAEVTYGVHGDGGGVDATGGASSTFNMFFDSALDFTNNAIVGGTISHYDALVGGYPGTVAADQFPATWNDVGFVNFSGGDYHLSSSSTLATEGTDGSAIGADIDQINAHGSGGDTVPPTASITTPSSGAIVSGSTQVTATASDNVAVARVEFWLDNTTLLGTATASPYSISWDTTAQANGSHTLVAKAFDTSNNEGDSPAISVDIENSGGCGSNCGQQNVVWTSVVNATVTGNSIQKNSGCAGCQDAGGVSQQQLSGVGSYVEFTPTVTSGGLLYAGLSAAPGTPPQNTQIDFAFGASPNGEWEVRELGVYKTDGTWTSNSVFKIAIESGPVVNYYVDGTLVWTSAVVPSGSYVVAADPFVIGDGVNNAVMSGGNGGGGLPQGWSTADIGATGMTGSASYANGTFTLTGAGANIWGTADSFRFVYQVLPGDGQLIAHVASIAGSTSSHSKAGVMIRSSLDPGAPEATQDFEPSNKEFLYRQTQGGTTILAGSTSLTAPAWLKIVRSGSTVTMYESSDGVNWTTNGDEQMPTGTAYIGFIVCSHDTTNLLTATFDQISQ